MAKEKIPHNRPDAKTVRSLLSYDQITGKLTWKFRSGGSPQWNGTHAGTQAGSVKKSTGYRAVAIFKRHYRSTHVIWCLMMGEWPKAEIDHKDTKRSNDAWDNLREATISQQRYNRRISKNNKSGFKWVVPRGPGMWGGQVMAEGTLHQTPPFDTPKAAYEAACVLAKNLHGEFVRYS